MNNKWAIFGILFLLAAALIVSCGGDSPGNGKNNSGTPENGTPENGTPENGKPENGGTTGSVGFATITGKIKITGDPVPAPEQKLMNKDPEVCGTGQRKIHWYRVSGGLLDETVVFLDGDFKGASWNNADVSSELIQKGCFFKPYIAIWRRGKEVKITSKDDAAHNIHTYERIGIARVELFNFNQPKQDVRTVTIKPRRSQFIELTCDNHDFMAGWRFVAKNPYCTLAKGGSFTLKVPAGKHTLKVWHPMLGELEQEIEVVAGDSKTLDFEYEYEAD